MATRAIVTSHPVVACDVCGRSLLRGESPDVFLAGGQRRTVCELCIPRAAAEGWLREADNHTASVSPTRARRAGSLLGRLRQLREPAQRPLRRETRTVDQAQGAVQAELPTEGLYDLFEGDIERSEPNEHELYIGAVRSQELGEASGSGDLEGPEEDYPPLLDDDQPASAGERSRPVRAAQPAQVTSTSGELKVARALQVFNAGEQPRRVAGVARSLGAPAVTVRPLEESGGTVAIVIAWELCWYRYEVDLGDEAAGSRLVAQGMELDELPQEDRLANASANEHGELSPLLYPA